MLENVNYSTNKNILKDDSRINTSDFVKQPSFKGNPNAVDTTPVADTYYPRPQGELPPEMGLGQTYIKYGLPAGLGLYYLSNLFDWANKGDYEKSLVGRLGKLGDRINDSSLIQNKFVRGLKTKGSTAKTRINSFIDNHATLRAMKETPTKPECKAVIGFLESQTERDLNNACKSLNKFIEKGPKTLKEAGATKDEIRTYSSMFKRNWLGKIKNRQEVITKFLIDKHHITMSAGAKPKDIRLSLLGISEGEFKLFQQSPVKYAKNIEDSLEKAKGYNSRLGGVLNKVKSISVPKTRLGKFLPKAAKLGMYGLTFGGGLANCLLLLGFFMSEPVKTTSQAPNDKKLSTGIHGLFDAISWVIAMPIAVKAMHAINGLKNLGKSKADVDRIDTKRKTINNRVKNRLYKNETVYNTEKAALEALKKASPKPKGWRGLVAKVANFLSISLEQTASYKEATVSIGSWGSNFKNWATRKNFAAIGRNIRRALPNFARNCVGYPLRFALYMFAFEPIVDKLFAAPLTAMFGKPYDPEKIREEHEKYNQHVDELRAMRGPSVPQLYGPQDPAAASGLDNADENNLSDDNLLKQRLTEMNSLPAKKAGSQNQQIVNNAPNQLQEVNGVQINTTTDEKPYMPGDNTYPNGQANGFANGQYSNLKDPNISDYDTVKRTYVPQLTSMDVPYTDPYADPAMEKNYNEMNNLYAKMDKAEQDALDVINDKRKL